MGCATSVLVAAAEDPPSAATHPPKFSQSCSLEAAAARTSSYGIAGPPAAAEPTSHPLTDRKSLAGCANAHVGTVAGPKTPDLSEEDCSRTCGQRLPAAAHPPVVQGGPGERFAAELSLVKHVFSMPVAFVRLNDRHDAAVLQCGASKADQEVLIIEDLTAEERDQLQDADGLDIPSHLRFFASAPLLSVDGSLCYGRLCIGDTHPRQLLPAQQPLMHHFAAIVSRELERDGQFTRQNEELQETKEQLKQASQDLDVATDGMLSCSVCQDGWPITHANQTACRLTGLPQHLAAGTQFWKLFELVPSSLIDSIDSMQEVICAGQIFTVTCRLRRARHSGNSARSSIDSGFGFGGSASLDPPRARSNVFFGGSSSLDPPRARGRQSIDGASCGKPPLSGSSSAAIDLALTGRASLDTALSLTADQLSTTSLAMSCSSRLLSSGDMFSVTFSPQTLSGGPTEAYATESGSCGAPSQRCWRAMLRPCDTPLMFHSPSDRNSSMSNTRYRLRPETMKDVQLGSLLGVGASGRTYRGLWHGSRVAVKIIDITEYDDTGSGSLDGSGSIRSGLLTGNSYNTGNSPLEEADLSKSLSHPHIVQTHAYGMCMTGATESGKQHKQMWIIQELCSRGTLAQAIQAGKFCDPITREPNLLFVMLTAAEVAGALAYLHSLGVVHGDLTGNNILLNPSTRDKRFFTAMVADFGLSRPMELMTTLSTGTCGTVSYMPPELIIDCRLSPSCDIYSAGVVLWELMSGCNAWEGMSGVQIVHAVTVLRRTLTIPETWPAEVQSLVRRCLDPDPKNRPVAKALLAELQAMLHPLMPRRSVAV